MSRSTAPEATRELASLTRGASALGREVVDLHGQRLGAVAAAHAPLLLLGRRRARRARLGPAVDAACDASESHGRRHGRPVAKQFEPFQKILLAFCVLHDFGCNFDC